MGNQFKPIDNGYINRNFNDRRITGKLGIPHSPENGGDYAHTPKKKPLTHGPKPKEDPFAPKRGPHDNPQSPGYGSPRLKPKTPKL